MNQHTELMAKATFPQIADFIRNGELSGIDKILSHEKNSINHWESLEQLIKTKLSKEDSQKVLDEMSNCLFRFENIAFHQGVQVGAKLLKELLQI